MSHWTGRIAAIGAIVFCLPGASPGGPPAEIPPPARLDALGDPLPAGALARLGTARLRQTAAPQCAVFSADASLLYTAEGYRIRVWEAKTGREVRTLETPTKVAPTLLAVSPDGTLLAACAQQGITLWDTATGQARGETAFAAPQAVLLAAFTPDGKSLAVVGNGAIEWFDAELRGPPRRSPLAQPIARCEAAPGGDPPMMAAYPHGPTVRADGKRQYPVRLLRLDSGAEVRQLEVPVEGAVVAVTISPDAKRVALAAGQGPNEKPRVELWDAAPPAKVRDMADVPAPVQRLAFSPDGKRLAGVTAGETAVLWNVESGAKEAEAPCSLRLPRPLFSPDSRALLCPSPFGRLDILDVATGRALVDLPGHFGLVRSVAISRDGKLLASGSVDRTVIVWDVAARKPLRQLKEGKALVDHVAFAPDGKLLAASGTGDRACRLWDPNTGALVRTLECQQDWVSYAFFLGGGRLATAGLEGNLRVWSLADGGQLSHVPAGHRITPMAASPDGRLLATASWLQGGERFPQPIRLWDSARGELAAAIATESPGILALEFSPCGRWLASSGVYRHEPRTDPRGATYSDSIRVELYEVQTGARVLRFDAAWARALAFSPDGRRIAGGSERSEVQIFSAVTGRLLHAYPGHAPRVDGVAFSPDGRVLASGGGDGTVLLWDADLAPAPPPAGPLTPEALAACWADLEGEPAAAYAAMWRLADARPEALAALTGRVKPCPSAEAEVAALLDKLKSDEYAERMKAYRGLELLASEVADVLEAAYSASDDADFRFHVKKLLGVAKAARSRRPELCRASRLVWVCEKAGGAQAESILRTLAQSGARQAADEAKGALARMGR